MSLATGGDAAAAAPASKLDSSVLELPDDIQFQLGQFKHLLSELQKALQAAAAKAPSPADLAAVSDPLERASMCMALAKAVNSLHHVYLRAQGRDPFTPATAGGIAIGRQELDRVRQYDKKVTRAVRDAELRASRPVLSLDVAAASRFIDAAIPDLTEQQRKDLKWAAQAVEAKRGAVTQRGSKKPRSTASRQQNQRQQQQQEEEDEELVVEGGAEEVEGVGGDGRARALGDAVEDEAAVASEARHAADLFLSSLAAADGASAGPG